MRFVVIEKMRAGALGTSKDSLEGMEETRK